MPRPVRVFDLFWADRDFKKALKNLNSKEKARRLEELKDLTDALSSCSHPTHDPALASWQPTAYNIRKLSGDVRLFEYRCRYPFRVIARWIDPCDEEPAGAVILIAATLSHDHERLKEVIFRKREDLG